MVEGLLNLGLFLPRYEVGMEVACSTLMMHLKKGKYTGHLHWDRMRKSPMEWGTCTMQGRMGVRETFLQRMIENCWPPIFLP